MLSGACVLLGGLLEVPGPSFSSSALSCRLAATWHVSAKSLDSSFLALSLTWLMTLDEELFEFLWVQRV